jgi:hypothetical protein
MKDMALPSKFNFAAQGQQVKMVWVYLT